MSTVGMWNYCVIASCQLLVCGTIVLLLHVNCWHVELLCYCFMSTDGMWNYCVIAACQLLVCGTIELLLHVNKGNNKITELRTILERESQNS